LISEVAPLGDDAVDRCADALEPTLRIRELGGCRRQAQAPAAAQIFAGKGVERQPPFAQRPLNQRPAVLAEQKIEHEQQGRRLTRELLHPARRGMNALKQGIEGERAIAGNENLAVEHEFFGFDRKHRLDQVGKVAGQRLACFRLQLDLAAVAKNETAKAVPFRLVLPFRAGRDSRDRSRFHRREWGFERKSQGETLAADIRDHNACGRLLRRPRVAKSRLG